MYSNVMGKEVMGRNTRGQSTVRKVYTLFFLLFIYLLGKMHIKFLYSYTGTICRKVLKDILGLYQYRTLFYLSLPASLLSLGFHNFSTHSILSYTSSSILDEDEQRLNPQRYFSFTIAWNICFFSCRWLVQGTLCVFSV